jgi:hypothetical protein
MFSSFLSNTLLAVSIGGIFFATGPVSLAVATYVAGFSIINWGLERNRG